MYKYFVSFNKKEQNVCTHSQDHNFRQTTLENTHAVRQFSHVTHREIQATFGMSGGYSTKDLPLRIWNRKTGVSDSFLAISGHASSFIDSHTNVYFSKVRLDQVKVNGSSNRSSSVT